MQIDQAVVRDQVARLESEGRRYTPRQLYYACCAAVEAPEVRGSTSQMGCGAVFFVMGVVGGAFFTFYCLPLVFIGMVIVGLGLQRRRLEQNRPTTRALAMSWQDFEREYLRPLRNHGAAVPTHLLLHADVDGATGSELAPVASDARTLVICDRQETALLVEAERADASLEAAVAVGAEAAAGFSGTVLVLHDCDAVGCALPLRVREAAPSARLVDVALRPLQIVGRVQLIESAPVVVPAELGEVLSVDEVAWLANGRRLELAVVATARLMDTLAAAAAAPPVAAASGVGLMSCAMFDEVPGATGVALPGGPATSRGADTTATD